jgi:hypothetical protein
MLSKQFTRFVALALALGSLSVGAVFPVAAANSTSLGHGVKCTWVLVSSINNTNTYKQVCRKGV